MNFTQWNRWKRKIAITLLWIVRIQIGKKVMIEIRLCDINRVLFRIAKSKNWKVLVREKYTDNLGFRFYFLVYFLRARTSQFFYTWFAAYHNLFFRFGFEPSRATLLRFFKGKFLEQHFLTCSGFIRDKLCKWLNPIPIINTGLAAVSNVPVMMAATCPSSVSLSFAMNLMIILITKPTAARWVVPGEMKLSGGFKWFITSQHGSKIRQLNIEINNVKRIPKTSSKIETIKNIPNSKIHFKTWNMLFEWVNFCLIF